MRTPVPNQPCTASCTWVIGKSISGRGDMPIRVMLQHHLWWTGPRRPRPTRLFCRRCNCQSFVRANRRPPPGCVFPSGPWSCHRATSTRRRWCRRWSCRGPGRCSGRRRTPTCTRGRRRAGPRGRWLCCRSGSRTRTARTACRRRGCCGMGRRCRSSTARCWSCRPSRSPGLGRAWRSDSRCGSGLTTPRARCAAGRGGAPTRRHRRRRRRRRSRGRPPQRDGVGVTGLEPD